MNRKYRHPKNEVTKTIKCSKGNKATRLDCRSNEIYELKGY